ncbi:MAG: hypothetical protein ACREN8_14230 [Candidatus Dormibacteraceae bacterium]
MAIDPTDFLEQEEAERVFADPEVRRSVEEYLHQEATGTLARGYTTAELRQRLGLKATPGQV